LDRSSDKLFAMKCPYCGDPTSTVREPDTRSTEGGVSRVRQCAECLRLFHTSERLDERNLRVQKRDGRTENFQRHKIADGIRRSARADVILEASISEMVDRVVGEIYKTGGDQAPSVPTHRVGELVLKELRARSETAHIRFAIVFQGRADLESVEDLLEWVCRAYNLGTPPPVISLDDKPLHVVKRNGRVQDWEDESNSIAG